MKRKLNRKNFLSRYTPILLGAMVLASGSAVFAADEYQGNS